MNSLFEESNVYVRGDKCLYKFSKQSANATLIATVPFLSFSDPLLMEDISHYIVHLNHPPPTLVHYLSHHLSICLIRLLLQLFLNDNLPGNTVLRFTPHKCGHKNRYNAFNVEVAAFLQIFWTLPSSQCVYEAFLRGENFMENHYNGPSKQLNRIQ